MGRSLHVIFRLTSRIRAENCVGDCHLVSCHLDNILRFIGAWLVDNPHKFANNVIKSIRVEERKSRDNKKLKDWYVRNKLAEEFPWVKSVYKETSGFIHLSK